MMFKEFTANLSYLVVSNYIKQYDSDTFSFRGKNEKSNSMSN